MNFLKKYKLIIFLAAIIIILALIKIYFGNTNKNQNKDNLITPTPTGLQTSNEDLFNKYQGLETEEEREVFLEKLTIKERDYILAEEPPEGYSLEGLLPYETNSFIVEKYIKEGVLLVKLKTDDKENIKKEVVNWINENKDSEEEDVLVWY